MLEHALNYARRGWAVFPLHTPMGARCSCSNPKCDNQGKHPRTQNGLNDATTDPAQIKRWWTRTPNANIAIRTGEASGFFVLDVDGDTGRQSLEDLINDYGALPDTPEAITGGLGRHILFKCDGTIIPNSRGKMGPGLDVRGDGGYIVAPPSLHVSGRHYEWDLGQHPDETPLVEAPAWLLALVIKPSQSITSGMVLPEEIAEGARNDTFFRMGCSLRDKGFSEGEIFAALAVANEARCEAALPERDIRTISKSASKYEPKHPLIDRQGMPDLIATLETTGQDSRLAFFNETIKPVISELSEIEREGYVKRIAKALDVPPKTLRSTITTTHKKNNSDSWKRKFELNQFQDPKACSNNFLLIFQNDPIFKGIRFNEMGGEIELASGWNNLTALDDAGEAMVRVHIDRNYDIRSPSLCRDALVWAAHQRKYHPLREYFKKLPAWDGKVRAETIFIDCLAAADTKYTRNITRIIFKAAYERVHNPGVKFDLILVLRGAQGIGKSVLISKIGMQWTHSSLRLTDMRDSKIAGEKIQGFWIIEIPELAGMTNADLETVKAFITAETDVYRAPYDRKTQRHKRQSIMIATTNSETGYLRDETGGRRFIDMFCNGTGRLSPMDLKPEYIDQLWAEVRDTYQAVPLYLTGADLAQATADQLNQVEQDPREDMVAEYLDKKIPKGWYRMTLYDRQAFLDNRTAFLAISDSELAHREAICTAEIYEEAFRLNKGLMQNKDRAAITRILMRLGWKKYEGKRWCGAYGAMRGFERP